MKNLRIALFSISMMAIILPLELWSQCTFCPSSVTNGSSSSALGFGNSALGASSTVIGFRSEAHAQGSIAIGKDLVIPSQFPYNIAIGSGYNENNKLINSFGPSLIVGFGSNIHTFIVNTAPSNGTTGTVGIGNVASPQAKLHIRGDAGEDADLLLEPGAGNQTALIRFGQNNNISARDGGDMLFETETDQAFVFENGNMGIGTNAPTAKLQVVGNMNVGNNPNDTIGLNAFVGGENSIATGRNAFAYGDEAKASNQGAFAVGLRAEANGKYSTAFGRVSKASNENAIALGYVAEAIGVNSIVIGRHATANNGNAYIIGSGVGSTGQRLVNSVRNSLMIGFESTVPTLFVGPSDGAGTTGNIGIGNITEPQAKLHILSDIDNAATLKLEHHETGANRYAEIGLGTHSIRAGNTQNMLFKTPGTNRHFVFENGNVGIGTSQPEAKLHVLGDFQVGSQQDPQEIRLNGSINATGEYATAFGHNNTASGNYSFVGGFNSSAEGTTSFAFGNRVIAEGASSFALGRFLRTSSSPSIIIGTGFDMNNPLINNIPNSFMVGFNSNLPTLIVSDAWGLGLTGRIGIGNVTSPEAKLHIRGDAGEDATIMLESTGTGKHARMFFTGEHHITASNGDDFKFRTTDESNFVFQNGDIFMEDINTGIIMKSPNGQCWRGTLNDQGVLVFAQTDCPDQASSIINLPTSGSEIKIYPNPTNLSITIESLNAMTHATWRLSALDSTTLASGKINSDKTEISLLHFVAGVYVLTIEHNGRIIKSEKVVKQ